MLSLSLIDRPLESITVPQITRGATLRTVRSENPSVFGVPAACRPRARVTLSDWVEVIAEIGDERIKLM